MLLSQPLRFTMVFASGSLFWEGSQSQLLASCINLAAGSQGLYSDVPCWTVLGKDPNLDLDMGTTEPSAWLSVSTCTRVEMLLQEKMEARFQETRKPNTRSQVQRVWLAQGSPTSSSLQNAIARVPPASSSCPGLLPSPFCYISEPRLQGS